MNDKKRGKRPASNLALNVLSVAACFIMAGQPASCEESGPAQAGSNGGISLSPVKNPIVSPDDAGMRVYVDPRTGTIRPEPAPGTAPLEISPQIQNSLSTSHQGLVETPSLVPGGGVKLDLQGRFQSPLAATIDATGKVRTHHLGETPESGQKK